MVLSRLLTMIWLLMGIVLELHAERNPEDIAWDAIGTDVVAECTGIFTTLGKAQTHITAGAKESCYFCTLC